MISKSPAEDRLIRLAPDCALVPERLLLYHARGRTLMITGAGTSRASGLPDFRRLVLDTYKSLDKAVHHVIENAPPRRRTLRASAAKSLDDKQRAEATRFLSGDYDVVLGMLERRMDKGDDLPSSVRQTADQLLRWTYDTSGAHKLAKPAPIHRALIKIADRGAALTIATTNFDRLLENAGRKVPCHSLGGIPRPGFKKDFAGVLHIHGAINVRPTGQADFVLTDRDFGEYYLRRRVVPDFIYDAARLYYLVLVGYSANDAPMRYLLNAVAADGNRFSDLKERFAFVGMEQPFSASEIEDWKGRGITPIPYDSASGHVQLLKTLETWAQLSAINGSKSVIERRIRAIVKTRRSEATEEDRDLFDHLYRRSSIAERQKMSSSISKSKAEMAWLDAISSIDSEPPLEGH